MGLKVGVGKKFEYNVEEAGSWSKEDKERVVKYLSDRGGDVEGTDAHSMIQRINEAKSSKKKEDS